MPPMTPTTPRHRRRRPRAPKTHLFRAPRRLFVLLALLFAIIIIFRRRIVVSLNLIHAYAYPLYATNQVPYSFLNKTTGYYDSNGLPMEGGRERVIDDFVPKEGDVELVPNIFHSLFLTSNPTNYSTTITMKPDWIRADKECKRLHPTAKFMRWTDANATQFIRDYYPQISDIWEGYGQNIQRSNILRYLLLHHYGGIYLDLDLMCLTNLDRYRYTYSFVTPPAAPSGVNNAFIASSAGHPFWAHMISKISYFNLPYPFPYLENMASTGCLFFTAMHLSAPKWVRDSMWVLPGKENRLKGRVVTPLFEHFGASSWHKGDAKMILALGQTIEQISKSGAPSVLLLLTVLGTALCWTYLRMKRQRKGDLERGMEGRRRASLIGTGAVGVPVNGWGEGDLMMEDYSLEESTSASGSGSLSGEEDIGFGGEENRKEKIKILVNGEFPAWTEKA